MASAVASPCMNLTWTIESPRRARRRELSRSAARAGASDRRRDRRARRAAPDHRSRDRTRSTTTSCAPTPPSTRTRRSRVRAETFDACGHGFTVVTMNAHDDSAMGEVAAAAGLRALVSPPAMFCYAAAWTDRPRSAGIRLERVHDAAGSRRHFATCRRARGRRTESGRRHGGHVLAARDGRRGACRRGGRVRRDRHRSACALVC